MIQAQIVNNDIQVWQTWFPKRGDVYYCNLDGMIVSRNKTIFVILSNNKINFTVVL